MQILFEDLTLQEAQVVVDALDNHRKLVAKLEQEAEQEMINRRAELDRALNSVLYEEDGWQPRRTYSKVATCSCPERQSCVLENLTRYEQNWMLGLCWDCSELGHEATAEEIKQWYLNRKSCNVIEFYPGPAGALRVENVSPELAKELGRVGLAGAEAAKTFKEAYEEYKCYVEQSGDLQSSFEDWYADGKPCGVIKLSEEAQEALERINTLSIAELIALGDLGEEDAED